MECILTSVEVDVHAVEHPSLRLHAKFDENLRQLKLYDKRLLIWTTPYIYRFAHSSSVFVVRAPWYRYRCSHSRDVVTNSISRRVLQPPDELPDVE